MTDPGSFGPEIRVRSARHLMLVHLSGLCTIQLPQESPAAALVFNKKVRATNSGSWRPKKWRIQADPKPNHCTSSVVDPYVFGPSRSGSICQRYGSGSSYHQAKIERKTLIPTPSWLLFDFLSLKNCVNVPSKISCFKLFKKFLIFVSILKDNDENIRIRIRIRIH